MLTIPYTQITIPGSRKWFIYKIQSIVSYVVKGPREYMKDLDELFFAVDREYSAQLSELTLRMNRAAKTRDDAVDIHSQMEWQKYRALTLGREKYSSEEFDVFARSQRAHEHFVKKKRGDQYEIIPISSYNSCTCSKIDHNRHSTVLCGLFRSYITDHAATFYGAYIRSASIFLLGMSDSRSNLSILSKDVAESILKFVTSW